MANVSVPSIDVATPASADTVVGVKDGEVKRFAVADIYAGAPDSGAPLASLIDPLDLRPISARVPCTFPSPYAAGGDAALDAMTADERTYMAHPSVLYIPEGWNGYRYWAAVTPYPKANNRYENPCVYCSGDGAAWTVPAGLTNPLVGAPADGYNADAFLFRSPDGVTMHVIYRVRFAARNDLDLMSSTDGVNWSDPVTIISGLLITPQDFASPSINWNGSAWELISHNLDAAGAPIQLRTSNGADLTGGFGSPTTITIPNLRGETWWHSDMRLTDDGYVGIAQDNDGGGGQLFWVQSSDKVNWGAARISDRLGFYKTGFALDQASGGVATVYIGMVAGGFRLYREVHGIGRTADRKASVAMDLAMGVTPPMLLHKDTFTRADSATVPGTPDHGAAYTVNAGTWGISGNRLYNVTTGNNRFFTNTGATSHEASITIQTAGSQFFLIVGGVDASNYYRIGVQFSTLLSVHKIIAGAQVTLAQDAMGNLVTGDVLTVRKQGDLITVFINGVLRIQVRGGALALGTNVGVQASGAVATYLDNLTVLNLS
jgi:hypothetical protein